MVSSAGLSSRGSRRGIARKPLLHGDSTLRLSHSQTTSHPHLSPHPTRTRTYTHAPKLYAKSPTCRNIAAPLATSLTRPTLVLALQLSASHRVLPAEQPVPGVVDGREGEERQTTQRSHLSDSGLVLSLVDYMPS